MLLHLGAGGCKSWYSFIRRVTWLCVIFWRHYEMRENNHAHSTAMSLHSNNWQCQPNIFEEKTFAKQKSALWIKLAMKIKFWHTWRLLRLNPGAQGEHLAHQPAFTAFTSVCTVYPKWVSPGVLYPIMLMIVLLMFRLTKGVKVMTLSFEFGTSNKKSCLKLSVSLACGDFEL